MRECSWEIRSGQRLDSFHVGMLKLIQESGLLFLRNPEFRPPVQSPVIDSSALPLVVLYENIDSCRDRDRSGRPLITRSQKTCRAARPTLTDGE